MTRNTASGEAAALGGTRGTSEVDMLAVAREAQWSPTTFLGPGSLKLVSPAKVNLLLSIGERRADGYHRAETVMHALALHDTMYLHTEPASADEVAKAAGVPGGAPAAGMAGAAAEPCANQALGGPADNLLVSIDLADRTGYDLVVPASDNLVFKAADRLARAVGRTAPERVSVRIEKHIPAQGGLGGGSSNAATMLVGLASAWGLAADDPRVEEVARSLGADVAFFLRGGCARLDGVGEVLQGTLTPSRQAVVLVKPPEGVSTAWAYRRFDEDPQPVAPSALAAARTATKAVEVPLANNLAPAAEALLPVLTEVHAWLAGQVGEGCVLLCGSGSATFALAESFEQASALAVAASKRGWWARPTSLSGLRAALVPARR